MVYKLFMINLSQGKKLFDTGECEGFEQFSK